MVADALAFTQMGKGLASFFGAMTTRSLCSKCMKWIP